MKDYIEERVLELARYIAETGATVRSAAARFRVSKSTVHKDITERLQEINPGLAAEVKEVLEKNKAQRFIRSQAAITIKRQEPGRNCARRFFQVLFSCVLILFSQPKGCPKRTADS